METADATIDSLSPPSAPTDVAICPPVFILQLIKDAQQQHGLRYDNYLRYRAYCSRKVCRTRKSLGFPNSQKNVSSKHQSKFQSRKVSIDVVSTDLKYLQIPLFDAERCWAYAVQLKQEMDVDQRSRKKFHMLSKLRKALKHATLLDSLIRRTEKTDALTKLEARAYNAWINGWLNFELKNWSNASASFNAAKNIYEKMSQALLTHLPDMAALYLARCVEIQPQIRFCEYNLSSSSDTATIMPHLIEEKLRIDANDIDDLIEQMIRNPPALQPVPPTKSSTTTKSMPNLDADDLMDTTVHNPPPASFQPTPAKPIFFDLALNHMRFALSTAKVGH